jgi:hypothetical protein
MPARKFADAFNAANWQILNRQQRALDRRAIRHVAARRNVVMQSEQPSPHLPPVGGRLMLGIGAIVALLVAGVIAIVMGAPASATIAFKNDTGQACSFCHATPGTDMRILTIEGQRYRNNGYKLVGPAPPAAAPLPSPATHVGASLWDHNGSIMRLVANGDSRQFLYHAPRQGMINEGVTNGTLLFEGVRNGDTYFGTAFVFRRRCGSFPFEVNGTVAADERTVTMRGDAPRIDGNCNISGHVSDTLVFRLVAPGAAAPIAQPQACKSEGNPCTSARQCCSGECIKGHAEGRPGAWCGSDAAPARPPAGAEGFAGMSCGQLWHARNTIFAEFGHCFKSERGIRAFGRGCFAPFGKLSASAQARVDNITSWERRKGCTG